LPQSNIHLFLVKSKAESNGHKRLESNALVRILGATHMLYFDHNATTPLCSSAREAWGDAIDQYVGNPSSPHRLGARADRVMSDAREQLAGFLGCSPLDIVWTSGATESNNLVLHHCAQVLDGDEEVWISSIEHPCVIEATRTHFPNRYKTLPVNNTGVLDLDVLKERLTKEKPGLIAVMAANNETGVLQPWGEVQQLCAEHRIPFFCDAAQWIGKLPAKGLGACDFVSGCAHKFGGPQGVGFLKCPANGAVHSQLVGGLQEEGRRAGTENVAGILSMMAALRERESQLASGSIQEKEAWRNAFVMSLIGAEVLGKGQGRLWNTVSALLPGDCRARWVVKLDKAGFAVSTGSACSSGKETPSHVLMAMGIAKEDADRVVRFSSGWETTAEEWQALVRGVNQVAGELA
jgi:cysteine desulfurase